MKDWFVYLVAGACTVTGVAFAAAGTTLPMPWSVAVLFMLYALHWLNERLEE